MSLTEISQPWAQHITLGASSTLHRMVSQHWDNLPVFLGIQTSQNTSGQAVEPFAPKKGSALQSASPAVMQYSVVAALGFFRSFLLLPYCSMLRRVGTGGSHPPLFPSVGFAIPPGSSMERHIPGDASLEQDAQGRATAVMGFVSHCLFHPKVVLPFPKCREKTWHLGTGPCLSPAPHPLLTPESRAGNTPSPWPCPFWDVCAQTPTQHLPGSPFSTRFKSQLQRSRQELKASSTLLPTRNQEQIC